MCTAVIAHILIIPCAKSLRSLPHKSAQSSKVESIFQAAKRGLVSLSRASHINQSRNYAEPIHTCHHGAGSPGSEAQIVFRSPSFP